MTPQLFSVSDRQAVLYVNVSKQRLYFKQFEFMISTAKNGCGEQENSFCTPRGWHFVREKIGAECAPYSVFVARRPTGEIYTRTLGQIQPDRDWILSRILWLSGLELGKNQGGLVDTFRRYIYIHGTPDETPLGVPLSKGCIRMHTQDLLTLFKHISLKTLVYIDDNPTF